MCFMCFSTVERLCVQKGSTAEEIVEEWMAYSAQNSSCPLDIHHVEKFSTSVSPNSFEFVYPTHMLIMWTIISTFVTCKSGGLAGPEWQLELVQMSNGMNLCCSNGLS